MMSCHQSRARHATATSRTRKSLILGASLALVLSACALEKGATQDQTRSTPPVGVETWIRTELYFGLSIPAGPDGAASSQISERDWEQFVDEEISPRFPDGLTILQVGGQWRSRPGDGHPVEVVHEQ